MSATNLYKGLAYFHHAVIELIERAAKKAGGGPFEQALSLDLNLTFHKYLIRPADNGYYICNPAGIDGPGASRPDGEAPGAELFINDKLVALLEGAPGKIYAIDFEKLEATPIIFASDTGNVKLAYTDNAPTMEIDGVKMHRSMGISPWEDSRSKVRDVVRKGMRVLDTCTGLGYTAIIAARQGASLVESFERNPAVLKTAGMNPWSSEFFTNERIHSNQESVFDAIVRFPDAHFEAVIHDPPRFSHAGELYSAEFYGQAFRVLAPGGKMFHYIGDPDSSFGKKHFSGVNKRLNEAGFETVIVPRHYGIMCRKK